MNNSNPESFFIKLYLVILSTNISHNKKYILSTNKDNIELPYVYLESQHLDNLEKNIITKAQEFVFTNELELLPQLINLHSSFIDLVKGELNVVYGFVINKIDNINNSYWIEFDYFTPNKYSNLIFETIQKLK